jgi:ketosteroid isomerase-like protein
MAMARSPQEVFAHHVQALGAGDLDGIGADYTDDAVYISPSGVLRGRTASGRRSPSCWPTCPTRAGT